MPHNWTGNKKYGEVEHESKKKSVSQKNMKEQVEYLTAMLYVLWETVIILLPIGINTCQKKARTRLPGRNSGGTTLLHNRK